MYMRNTKTTVSKAPPTPKKRVLYNPQWTVVARAHNRSTGEPIGEKSVEVVDLEDNKVFEDCAPNAQAVRARYETFWNDTDPDSNEVVWVEECWNRKETTPYGQF